jgi:hypothetical protein
LVETVKLGTLRLRLTGPANKARAANALPARCRRAADIETR